MNLKYRINDGLKRYTVPQALCTQMFNKAQKASSNTYPLPNKVSCAVLTDKGTIIPGAEYRADILTLSMHAEATALTHAAIHGEPNIIAITGPNCHACKQLLWENAVRSGNDIMILIKAAEKIKKIPLSKMMQYPWPENKWKKK